MLASDDNQHAQLLAAVACPTVNPVGKTPSAKILTPKVPSRCGDANARAKRNGPRSWIAARSLLERNRFVFESRFRSKCLFVG
jgi:hypothetical protein